MLQKAVADGVEVEESPDWGVDEHEPYACEQVSNSLSFSPVIQRIASLSK